MIWEISDWRQLVKPSGQVLLCFVPPSGGFSALGATDATERCLEMSDMSWLSLAHNFCLQPHICNDNRLRQASEKCLLLYDSSCQVNVHKINHSIVIPKSNYYNKFKNQTKTKPELKWWKSSTLLHNVKHTQKATFSAKLSCSSPSQERSDFNSVFSSPKKEANFEVRYFKGSV